MESTVKPLFKKIFYVRRTSSNRCLRIGELLPNRAIEIDDEDGLIARLIQLMDGTNNIESLWAELTPNHPELSKSDLIEMIGELDSLGYLDDACSEQRTSLQPEELNRFKANLNYLSYYSNMSRSALQMQEQLKNTQVTIIGIGTLGAGVLFNLACLGISSVRIVDFDRVELSNLNRQMLYNERDIGRKKIDAATDFIRLFYSAMNVEQMDLEITSADVAKRAIAGSHVVVLAADQPHIQLERWVNEACVELGVPLIGGGVHMVEGMFYAVIPGQTGCIECNHLTQSDTGEDHSSFIREFLSSGFRMPSTAIAAHYMLLIGAVSSEIVRLITGITPMQSAGKVISIDFQTYTSEVKMDFSVPNAHCPLCIGG